MGGQTVLPSQLDYHSLRADQVAAVDRAPRLAGDSPCSSFSGAALVRPGR